MPPTRMRFSKCTKNVCVLQRHKWLYMPQQGGPVKREALNPLLWTSSFVVKKPQQSPGGQTTAYYGSIREPLESQIMSLYRSLGSLA